MERNEDIDGQSNSTGYLEELKMVENNIKLLGNYFLMCFCGLEYTRGEAVFYQKMPDSKHTREWCWWLPCCVGANFLLFFMETSNVLF